MADYIYSLILLIIALVAIELRKSYHEIPKNELRHRARGGDVLAGKIYTAVAYEESLDGLLWLVIILCAAGSLLFFNIVAPLWLSFIAVALFIWLAFALIPRTRSTVVSKKLATYLTPGVVWVLNYVHPVFQKLHSLLIRSNNSSVHTGIYSKKDLSELVENQKKQPDNRIRPADLELIKKALKLSDKSVGEYCSTWSKIHSAKANDAIGPVLLDELHKSGQQFVPVVDAGDKKKVVGMIELTQLDISRSGYVSDQMNPNVYYLSEEDTLEDALNAMTSTGRPAFVVIDSKQRLLGMVTLRDVLSELFTLDNNNRDYTLSSSEPDESDESEAEGEPDLAES